MIESVKKYCNDLVKEFDKIPAERKIILEKITQYITQKSVLQKPVNLVYICTHNSRRSHFGQVWAQVASNYFGVKNVYTFSGGTEATAFNINAINALKRVGFAITSDDKKTNHTYKVSYDASIESITCFSKIYNDDANPQKEFAAIMTCSNAEENCPFIPGVELRVGTTYDDPKAFDNTAMQDAKYDERCKQIALETFYVFSKLK